MKIIKVAIIYFITFCFFTTCFAQDCDKRFAYREDDKYSIYLLKILTGQVQNNPTDTMHGMICKTRYIKTPNSSGINLSFWFLRCGEMMDASVKVKIDFADGASIFLSRSVFDKDNKIWVFNFMAGGKYGFAYELLLLRTKLISKVSISGNQIDSYTYTVNTSDGLEFMLGMGCLWELAKE